MSKKDTPPNLIVLVPKKIEFFKDVIQKTIIFIKKNKQLDILALTEINICMEKLNEINLNIDNILNKDILSQSNVIINELQNINNELSLLLKNYGTESLDDLLTICFGNLHLSKNITNELDILKLDLLRKYFHPTGYKLIQKKEGKSKTEIFSDDMINENTRNLSCFDNILNDKKFYLKVYGLKLYVNNPSCNKSLLISGFVDDIMIDYLNNKYIFNIQNLMKENIPNDDLFQKDKFEYFIHSLTLKDYFIYDDYNEIYNKFIGYFSQLNSFKQKTISQNIKDFIACDLYSKRNTLIQLLIQPDHYENQYVAYLLYDLLSTDNNGVIDSQEQVILYDSFPWVIKHYFKNAMKKTIQYTNDLLNYDLNKIPLEQQICLLKVPDHVKEKAMIKLKEVKAKTEDSGTKARQYLDNLLKIPFSIYKKEPILSLVGEARKDFTGIIKLYNSQKIEPDIAWKDKYASIEIIRHNSLINKNLYQLLFTEEYISELLKKILSGTKQNILSKYEKIKDSYSLFLKETYEKADEQTCLLNKENYSKKDKSDIIKHINDIIIKFYNDKSEFMIILDKLFMVNQNSVKMSQIKMYQETININNKFKKIKSYINDVKTILDQSVHGHDNAKKQIERIIGQWMNGELDGYCFGFEGPPGVGKTSLAKKGLSNCLKDENGVSRPFSMIQIGGDSNGSTLQGHNYTYVGSTWGSIVQILIDKKCMNPIIFIDEVDKISKTEHGKEIIGILTHLLDPAQNDCFQDKYFSGIDLDLSKALFILSYNDVSVIDKILLDRIHRIKFSNLSLEDKLVISKSHLLPDIYKKVGLEDMIVIDDNVLKFIIDEYTIEPGVRKLKEVLFEIISEININILKNTNDYDIPIVLTIEDIKTKYFKDKHEIKHKKIHSESMVGVINCLYATAAGTGGILPANAKMFPSNRFLEFKLTGLLDDMMKESMHIALTLAFNLTDDKTKTEFREKYDGICKYGIHLHAGDGSTNKSGTSAGIANTILLYSLINNKKIKNTFAVTGEAHLDGSVNEIGALTYKFLGGIKAGVKQFLFPKENEKDYKEFLDKYGKTELVNGISFYPISNIHEAFELIFE